MEAEAQAARDLSIVLALDSVVKVVVRTIARNYIRPWQDKTLRESARFLIRGKKILTTAHVLGDYAVVNVTKHGSVTRYRAEVEVVGDECDLALLTVKFEEFWKGTTFLELGDIPLLQDSVAVVGYPRGGKNITVTKGVVSRVEPTQYVHGATQLLAIQIDAAINPGHSGDPAVMANKVVGVAFQHFSGAENIGYIIPVPVIKHFISGVVERGRYTGFCSLGLSCQTAENVQLRMHFGILPEMTGVLVSRINPLFDANTILKKDDIILAFDGVPIANDGTVPFRNREQITLDYLVSMKKPNETALLRVLRDGKEHEFNITVRPLQPLIPVHQFDKLPNYYIFAGLVFVPLIQSYLHEYGEDWYNTSPRRLCERALRELPKKAGQQLSFLVDISTGFKQCTKRAHRFVENRHNLQELRHRSITTTKM
ncbi:hypothetical protein K2173_003836 [Erythroxylum novogranatense]|uniref:Protease Do-like PDZ domain-containing protein n=1 Tax=Erythroxylum novogranatense TaxID=1862640 RepID=A0AAV8S3Y5_9ROSI|nr:hypothetical protein K2173_003836 [Erythroxylum novogranatense]